MQDGRKWGCAGERRRGRLIRTRREGRRPPPRVLVAFSRSTLLLRTSGGGKGKKKSMKRSLCVDWPRDSIIRQQSSDRWSYGHELHVLEQFLYEASGGQAKHTVGQEVRDLGVEADVVECIGELLLYPAKTQKNTSNTEITIYNCAAAVHNLYCA